MRRSQNGIKTGHLLFTIRRCHFSSFHCFRFSSHFFHWKITAFLQMSYKRPSWQLTTILLSMEIKIKGFIYLFSPLNYLWVYKRHVIFTSVKSTWQSNVVTFLVVFTWIWKKITHSPFEVINWECHTSCDIICE